MIELLLNSANIHHELGGETPFQRLMNICQDVLPGFPVHAIWVKWPPKPDPVKAPTADHPPLLFHGACHALGVYIRHIPRPRPCC